MKRIEMTIETVTPLFLAGADPRGQPELRAASVRGALRFWLRALAVGLTHQQAAARLDVEVITIDSYRKEIVRLCQQVWGAKGNEVDIHFLREWLWPLPQVGMTGKSRGSRIRQRVRGPTAP